MPQLRILQLCLANAMRDERVPEYRYSVRHYRMCKLLEQFITDGKQPDIISIKELRDSGTLTIEQIISDLATAAQMSIAEVAPVKSPEAINNPKYKPFNLGLLYNPKSLTKLGAWCIKYHDEVFGEGNGPNMGTALLLAHFASNVDGHTFAIESCHLPIIESHKDAVVAWMHDKLPDVRNAFVPKYDTLIRTGDFNTFVDKPEHVQQLALLGDGLFSLTSEKYAYGTNTPLFGTFYPFPHDVTPGFDIAKPTENSLTCSKLDHMWVSCKPTELHCELVPTFVDAIPLTDHLPMLVWLKM